MNPDNLPITYHAHTQHFNGVGKGFTPQTGVNFAIGMKVHRELIQFGEIKDNETFVMAKCIRDSIDNRN